MTSPSPISSDLFLLFKSIQPIGHSSSSSYSLLHPPQKMMSSRESIEMRPMDGSRVPPGHGCHRPASGPSYPWATCDDSSSIYSTDTAVGPSNNAGAGQRASTPPPSYQASRPGAITQPPPPSVSRQAYIGANPPAVRSAPAVVAPPAPAAPPAALAAPAAPAAPTPNYNNNGGSSNGRNGRKGGDKRGRRCTLTRFLGAMAMLAALGLCCWAIGRAVDYPSWRKVLVVTTESATTTTTTTATLFPHAPLHSATPEEKAALIGLIGSRADAPDDKVRVPIVPMAAAAPVFAKRDMDDDDKDGKTQKRVLRSRVARAVAANAANADSDRPGSEEASNEKVEKPAAAVTPAPMAPPPKNPNENNNKGNVIPVKSPLSAHTTRSTTVTRYPTSVVVAQVVTVAPTAPPPKNLNDNNNNALSAQTTGRRTISTTVTRYPGQQTGLPATPTTTKAPDRPRHRPNHHSEPEELDKKGKPKKKPTGKNGKKKPTKKPTGKNAKKPKPTPKPKKKGGKKKGGKRDVSWDAEEEGWEQVYEQVYDDHDNHSDDHDHDHKPKLHPRATNGFGKDLFHKALQEVTTEGGKMLVEELTHQPVPVVVVTPPEVEETMETARKYDHDHHHGKKDKRGGDETKEKKDKRDWKNPGYVSPEARRRLGVVEEIPRPVEREKFGEDYVSEGLHRVQPVQPVQPGGVVLGDGRVSLPVFPGQRR
ncbi:hypothetical protein B0T20DRAFT_406741 [Sordaria brevicollis]|uniref:Uncharacterized protein n=1 Tax=Sordaria brevicollis TaxID=83679 RepID=A0AAE0UDR2_SORBR|nr:hypothetical protein B0T20DRAFT_406741 [Sordaria brevicollis]